MIIFHSEWQKYYYNLKTSNVLSNDGSDPRPNPGSIQLGLDFFSVKNKNKRSLKAWARTFWRAYARTWLKPRAWSQARLSRLGLTVCFVLENFPGTFLVKLVAGSNELLSCSIIFYVKSWLKLIHKTIILMPRDAHRSHAHVSTRKTALKIDFWGCELIRWKHSCKNLLFNLDS